MSAGTCNGQARRGIDVERNGPHQHGLRNALRLRPGEQLADRCGNGSSPRRLIDGIVLAPGNEWLRSASHGAHAERQVVGEIRSDQCSSG